jgi:hypothetical protein
VKEVLAVFLPKSCELGTQQHELDRIEEIAVTERGEN